LYYALVGYGVGNRALATKLKKIGHRVFVSESRYLSDDEKSSLLSMDIEFEEGQNTERICEADFVVVSPSVKPDHPVISKCPEKTVTDIDVVLNMKRPRVVVGVTGSNGKTTTCSMIFHVLKALGLSSYLCGNIGEPVANLFGVDPEYVVLELSSFQLFWSKQLPIDLGVILNVKQNHLDWHPTFEHYVKSKLKIFEFAKLRVFNISDRSLINVDQNDDTFHSFEPLFVEEPFSRITYDGRSYHFKNDLLWTFQNLENLSAVLKVFSLLNVEPSVVLKALEDFRPPRHRMEFVRKVNGITFIDDSKATSAAATVSALENFTSKNVILILSGRGKNEDYATLVEEMKKKVKHAFIFGEIVNAIEVLLKKESFPFTIVNDMEQAVYNAIKIASDGDVVLLSPAGASFDLYENYSKRGDHFVRVVESLQEGEG